MGAFRRRTPGSVLIAGIAVGALALGACGGGDDDDDAGTTTTGDDTGTATTIGTATTVPAVTTTLPAVTTTVAPVDYVTAGATVVVANASNINGAAGRMSEQLEVAGWTMGEPANYAPGQLEVTEVFYDPENPDAQAVADSLRLALGGGEITVSEMGTPPPTDSGDIGDATVLVAMGNDTADKTLSQLQGTSSGGDDDGGDSGTADSGTADSGTDESSDESDTAGSSTSESSSDA